MYYRLLGLIFLTAFLCSCKRGNYFFAEGGIQGTSYHITYQSPDNIDFADSIANLLHAFDLSLSTYNPNSKLSRINNNDSTATADEYIREVYAKALEINQISDGMFDITVGPLVNAWGFGPGRKLTMDKAVIDSLLQFVGMEKIQLKGNKVLKSDPRIKIDVNAIAQGYSCDVVSKFLEKQGSRNYLVEIGGEVRARGKNPDGNYWTVGVDRPVDGSSPGQMLQTVVHLKNRSIATSGNYRRYYIENGKKIVHHINPKTGYPQSSSLLSVSIVAKDCITADALGTACITSGLEKSREILKRIGNVEGYFIYADSTGQYQVYMTDGMKEYLDNPAGY